MGVSLKVNNKRFKCSITLNSKTTVIVGDSGKGKTAFAKKLANRFQDVEISEDYDIALVDNNMFSSILKRADRIRGDKSLKEFWSIQSNLPILHSVIIIDDEDFIKSDEFKLLFQLSYDNYFIFMNRSKLVSIQFGVTDIYEMHQNNEYHELLPVYTEQCSNVVDEPDIILVEDSGSGYTFFSKLCKNKLVLNSSSDDGNCVSGKDNIINVLYRLASKYKYNKILLLVDYDAFGNNILDIISLIQQKQLNVYFYFKYKSFEYLLLKTKLINDDGLDDYVSKEFLKFDTRERIYTKRLMDITKDTEFKYSKSSKSFPVCFYLDCCQKRTNANCKFKHKLRSIDKFKYMLEGTEFEELLSLR